MTSRLLALVVVVLVLVAFAGRRRRHARLERLLESLLGRGMLDLLLLRLPQRRIDAVLRNKCCMRAEKEDGNEQIK